MKNNPIGIFDSGIGGYSIFIALKKVVPREKVIYVLDNKYSPYGYLKKSKLKERSIEVINFLISKKSKIIIIACNTATAMALNSLKNEFNDVPIIGVIEPGSEKAISKTTTKKIGVIGTIATISSGAYEKAIQKKELNLIEKIG